MQAGDGDQVGLLSGTSFFFFLMAAGAVAVACTRNHRQDMRFQMVLFLGAFALRYAMSVVIYSFGLIDVLKDEDGSGWTIGVVFHRAWVEQGNGILDLPRLLAEAYSGGPRHMGYYYMLGGLYFFVDEARLPAAALNGMFGSLMIVYAYRIGAALFGPGVGRRVAVWLCVLPSMVIWSSQTIKEPVVMFLETLAVYGCVNVRRAGVSVRHAALAVVCIALLIPFRFYAAYVTSAALFAAAAIPRFHRGRLSFGPTVALVIVAVLMVYSGGLAVSEKEQDMLDARYINTIRTYAAEGGSGVKSDADLASTTGIGLSLLVGSVHLLLAPFPWHLASGSLRMLMVAPEMIFWWWLFFAGAVPGFLLLVRTRFADTLPMLIVLLGFGLLYSLTFGNVGLVYRQRAQLMPWLLTFAAVGLERRRLGKLGFRPDPDSPAIPNVVDAPLVIGPRAGAFVPEQGEGRPRPYPDVPGTGRLAGRF